MFCDGRIDAHPAEERGPAKRAERYQKLAEEYAELANAASSPFLRAYYQRMADCVVTLRRCESKRPISH
jgi:hypothetical protein